MILALSQAHHPSEGNFCFVEMGSAFSACMIVKEGKIVDGLGGTSGPVGYRSGGAMDGEVAYQLSPLRKEHLFSGGISSYPEPEQLPALVESLIRQVAGLRAVTPFEEIILSGRLLEQKPQWQDRIVEALQPIAPVRVLKSLPNAWVKHAAQGAAIIADGLSGGQWKPWLEWTEIHKASGTVLDWLTY